MNIEVRELNTIWSKSGTGSPTTKICLPISWLYNMQISKENRKVKAYYDYDKKEILIKK